MFLNGLRMYEWAELACVHLSGHFSACPSTTGFRATVHLRRGVSAARRSYLCISSISDVYTSGIWRASISPISFHSTEFDSRSVVVKSATSCARRGTHSCGQRRGRGRVRKRASEGMRDKD